MAEAAVSFEKRKSYWWFKCFSVGKAEIIDKQHSGRPAVASEVSVDEDRMLFVRGFSCKCWYTATPIATGHITISIITQCCHQSPQKV